VPSKRRRDVELATFLRSRRERLHPEEVGLPPAGRRRTQGLRREEVAVLAGLSTTWYTYLEQGRGRDVSPSVLDSVARVLRLSEDERRYMHILVFGHVVGSRPIEAEVPVNDLLRQVTAIADNHPYPVFALDPACDLIRWNHAATEWYDNWSRLAEKDRNFMLWLVTADEARECFDEWESSARDVVARWRGEVARWPDDKRVQERVAELQSKSHEFAHWWASHEVLEHRSGIRRLRHPKQGVRDWRIVPMSTFYGSAPAIIFHLPV
jgi:transcriptional regulator with XRE-family HTH domain